MDTYTSSKNRKKQAERINIQIRIVVVSAGVRSGTGRVFGASVGLAGSAAEARSDNPKPDL
jgi:hypothetical protein